jgi:hypothetical protein
LERGNERPMIGGFDLARSPRSWNRRRFHRHGQRAVKEHIVNETAQALGDRLGLIVAVEVRVIP